jgi:hypothetical protein
VGGPSLIAKVKIIKDFLNGYSIESRTNRIEFDVRVIQKDGEIAWRSPIWARTTKAGAGL